MSVLVVVVLTINTVPASVSIYRVCALPFLHGYAVVPLQLLLVWGRETFVALLSQRFSTSTTQPLNQTADRRKMTRDLLGVTLARGSALPSPSTPSGIIQTAATCFEVEKE